MSLNVYLREADIPKNKTIINGNDAIFGKSLLSNDSFSNNVLPEIQYVMKKIDGADYISKRDMRDRFGNLTSIENLSTGCKSIINCINYPQYIVNCIECGRNAIDLIIHRTTGNILLQSLPKIDNQKVDIDLHLADGTVKHYSSIELFVEKCEEMFKSVGY